MSITQRDSWDLKKRTGQLEVEVRGVPIKIAATMRLADEGKGSANTLSWNVSCGIPLIGGKLEKLLISDIQAKADADLAASRKILADYCCLGSGRRTRRLFRSAGPRGGNEGVIQ